MGRGSWITLVVFAMVVLANGWNSEAKAQCPTLPNLAPLSIAVSVVEPQIIYHHDVDLFGLPKIENSAERPPPGQILLGLTQLMRGVYVIPYVVTVPRPGGIFCVWLTRVEAVLGAKVMDVYIASEYEPDTCEYGVILNHEKTHVRINLETLRAWAPTLQAALTETAKRKFPAVFTRAPVDNDIANYLTETMRATFDLMNEEMARRNAALDTPENYRRENAKCRHWSRHDFQLDRPENNPEAKN